MKVLSKETAVTKYVIELSQRELDELVAAVGATNQTRRADLLRDHLRSTEGMDNVPFYDSLLEIAGWED